jgi:hypothetical protein
LEFHLLVVGVPVIVLFLFIMAILLLYCFLCKKKKKYEIASEPHTSTHVNTMYQALEGAASV